MIPSFARTGYALLVKGAGYLQSPLLLVVADDALVVVRGEAEPAAVVGRLGRRHRAAPSWCDDPERSSCPRTLAAWRPGVIGRLTDADASAQSACRMNEGLHLMNKLGHRQRYSAGQSIESLGI